MNSVIRVVVRIAAIASGTPIAITHQWLVEFQTAHEANPDHASEIAEFAFTHALVFGYLPTLAALLPAFAHACLLGVPGRARAALSVLGVGLPLLAYGIWWACGIGGSPAQLSGHYVSVLIMLAPAVLCVVYSSMATRGQRPTKWRNAASDVFGVQRPR